MTYKYISSNVLEQISIQIRRDALCNREDTILSAINIYKIAKELGCLIEIVDFQPNNISARIVRNESLDCKCIIQVSIKDSIRRRNFSIAHIILHDNGEDEFIEYRQALIDYVPEDLYKETQANMLASALLLPAEAIKLVWNESQDVAEIADVFNISKEAVCNRLINLGLLQDE